MLTAGVRFSMDGRGRFHHNAFIERLWQSLRYKVVYLHELRVGLEADTGHRLAHQLRQQGATAFGSRRTYPREGPW